MTLFDKPTQDTFLKRIEKLSATSQRKWGTMSVSQMLKHLSIAFSVPTGKLILPKDKLFYLVANPIARYLMIKVMTKWPKNMTTVDAFKVKEDPEFVASKVEFMNNLYDFLKANHLDGSHPAFGVMSKELWGQAMAIHLNHHLEQFGV